MGSELERGSGGIIMEEGIIVLGFGVSFFNTQNRCTNAHQAPAPVPPPIGIPPEKAKPANHLLALLSSAPTPALPSSTWAVPSFVPPPVEVGAGAAGRESVLRRLRRLSFSNYAVPVAAAASVLIMTVAAMDGTVPTGAAEAGEKGASAAKEDVLKMTGKEEGEEEEKNAHNAEEKQETDGDRPEGDSRTSGRPPLTPTPNPVLLSNIQIATPQQPKPKVTATPSPSKPASSSPVYQALVRQWCFAGNPGGLGVGGVGEGNSESVSGAGQTAAH